jgi:hypothetical protein
MTRRKPREGACGSRLASSVAGGSPDRLPVRSYPIALVVIVSCGGQTSGVSSDAGREETGSVTDGSVQDSVAGNGTVADGSQDSGTPDHANTPDASDATLPAVGTPACENLPCILCADGYYHCHSLIYTPCMADVSMTMNCVNDAIPTTGCLTCSNDGGGSVWECGDGGWNVQFNEFECTP